MRPLYMGVHTVLAGCLVLGGCTTHKMSISQDLGNAVRQVQAMQIIDPHPVHARTALPASSGARAVLAMERYIADDVEKPERLTTSDIQSGSGRGGRGGNQ